MLSRERDQLGSSIRQVERPYIESLDRKKDSELNLASHVVYDEIEKTVVEGDWDGYHGGFPCSSFSRVRWRDWPGGAHLSEAPHTSMDCPSSRKKQTRDEGSLMAVRSGWLHQKQAESFQRRAVPEASIRWRTQQEQNTVDRRGTYRSCRLSSPTRTRPQLNSTLVPTRQNSSRSTSRRDGQGSWSRWAHLQGCASANRGYNMCRWLESKTLKLQVPTRLNSQPSSPRR